VDGWKAHRSSFARLLNYTTGPGHKLPPQGRGTTCPYARANATMPLFFMHVCDVRAPHQDNLSLPSRPQPFSK
jgi:hypothetical protein